MPEEEKKTVPIDTSGPDAEIDIEETKDESVVETGTPAQETDKTYDNEIDSNIKEDLAWGSHLFLTATAAASILIHNNGKNILIRGISYQNDFKPGETCNRSISDNKLISLTNTKFYPGREEFYNFCPKIPSVLIIPINKKAFILVGGWSSRCFTKSDEKWIDNWSKKINNIFTNYGI